MSPEIEKTLQAMMTHLPEDRKMLKPQLHEKEIGRYAIASIGQAAG